jgi:5'/3'-nucleotidase SurE
VNIALHHLATSQPSPSASSSSFTPPTSSIPIDLVLSGPNLGRNAGAGSTLSSGTLGAALEASVLGYKSIALSFAFFGRDTVYDPEKIDNACEMGLQVVSELWENWPDDKDGHGTLNDGGGRELPDLYNVNVPLVSPPKREVVWTKFQSGNVGFMSDVFCVLVPSYTAHQPYFFFLLLNRRLQVHV